MTLDLAGLQQAWPAPAKPRPIVILGGGDIVRDAHIPAYRKAGLPVAGVYDLDRIRAEARAAELGGGARVFATLAEVVAFPDAVFDVATPPKAHREVIAQLPDGAAAMIQKPMGRTWAAACAIHDLCRSKQLTAAINFQLRFSPYMLAIRDLVRRGELGDLVDVEVHLNLGTPWEVFPFLIGEERVEILIHSVHYLDLIRSLLGNPRGAYARTVKHPRHANLASTRSSIILDYGEMTRCCLSLNHCHYFGPEQAAATFRIEGTEGCAVATLGLLLDYPKGRADRLDIITRSAAAWQTVPLRGGWFPDGFIGTMHNLQRVASGEDAALISPVADALETMRLVEACYRSNATGGVELGDIT
jgi:predicted dehydrogenase